MHDKSNVQKIQTRLIELTTAFCRSHLNQEYEALCQKLIEKMARKRTVPFLTGRIEIWAAAAIYAIGSINFLFDKATQPYVTPDTITEHFGVSKSTVGQKAKVIRDMFKMGYYDATFSTQHMAQNNPFADLTLVNGFLVSRDS
jgi:transcriptional antiterminator